MRLSVFEVPNQKIALAELRKLTQKSVLHPRIREAALTITSDCPSRNDECELEAIYKAVKHGDARVPGLERGLRYVSDPRMADHFTAPHRTLDACERGACGEDCLPAETLLLGAGCKPVAIQDVNVGDVIMGDGKWVRVTEKWDKGVQEILEFELNNGSTLQCTPEHKVFRVPKGEDGRAGPRDAAEEVRASELRPGDDLLTVQSLPFGQESLGDDKAWLLGLHISDGKDIRPHARIKSISEGSPTPTFDIEVEGHRFYLPETDLVVHNCDGASALVAALTASIGFKSGLRTWGPKGSDYTHVYAVVALPKRKPEFVVGMDTTVAEAHVGWEPRSGHTMTAWLE